MQALLGPGTQPEAARSALDLALLAEADPMHWCALHLGVSNAEIMRRGADWSGFAFFDVVPRIGQLTLEPDRLERLAEVRFYRARIADRDVAFVAPDFFELLRLAEMRRSRAALGRSLCLVPAPALRSFMAEQASVALVDGARQNMARRWPRAAAQLELTAPVRHTFVLLLVVLTALLLVGPVSGHPGLMPFWLLLVMIPSALRLAALFVPVEREVPLDPLVDPALLPTYTVLVPLRDEANMVDQLYAALTRIDYPPERLEIIFVVEETSPATVAAVRRHLSDARFSLLVVPDAAPRTKPKALGFALPMCRGELLVVYDAEDRPAPDQLRRIAAQFQRQPDIACIQARLVIDNGGRGLLPSLFAGEYAGLFSVLLPALARWGLVMPLGGTSNHFRTSTLRALGGWDAFNVTEDADLGVRLARRKLRCAVSTSHTLEAAPGQFSPWLGQRTRWMKGWMQTYVVHNRHLPDLIRDLGGQGTWMFQIVLMGMLLAPLLHAGFLIVMLLHLAIGQLAWPLLQPWPLACLAVFVIGHACAIATNLVGLARTGQRHLWAWQLLVPVYWVLIALATLRAMREFAQRPFHWFKTPHSATPSDPPDHSAGKRAQRFGRKAIWDRSPAG
jgi:cellulose synthase/poly-beta-1,6-N-acetylglucosamine synthase-like glycosyltransferase